MAEPLIDARDLNLTLGRGDVRTEILHGVNLALQPGETVAVLGASGSGKSSLLSIVAGLERPDGGSIRVLGEDLASLGEDQLARLRGRSIGVVLQAFHLLPTMTALENVAVPLELSGAANPFARARDELVAVGLGHRASHYPAQMSGGEQQRVAIARATAGRPRLLLADEPTGNLDEATGKAIIELLFDRASAAEAGLLVITHDPAVAARAGRILRMADGRLSEA
ncbi:ATP-binding cassette domain-containing protein [Sphingomonas ginkgonis]|uniref:ATP-binding cassette domain-containing protein n=1 Tax=Sphingomonas ginkgonis TaxID=2315330 RepID=A0A3S0EK79_9SPHN|nr:ATP-binding cassette domain-containing protein [Sphingomonas ginkgonis]RST29556.1 ATP-binding cassette domain-containing protein [Sphingomonas ginkgonis]